MKEVKVTTSRIIKSCPGLIILIVKSDTEPNKSVFYGFGPLSKKSIDTLYILC